MRRALVPYLCQHLAKLEPVKTDTYHSRPKLASCESNRRCKNWPHSSPCAQNHVSPECHKRRSYAIHSRNENHSIKNRRKSRNARHLDGNHKRRVAGRRTSSVCVVKRVHLGWDNQTHEEEVDDVEDSNTPDDLLGCSRYLLSRVVGFGRSKSSKLSPGIGERSCDEHGTEAVEAVQEGVVR